MKVKVYRNLRHGRKAPAFYSVVALEGPSKGKVIARTGRVMLRGVTFRVSEAGRQRVLQQKRKNVHAFVVGDWQIDTRVGDFLTPFDSITYNPYKAGHFCYRDTNLKVTAASFVVLDNFGMEGHGVCVEPFRVVPLRDIPLPFEEAK